MATALVVGNMIGSGVFLLPAALARFGGIAIFGWLATTAGAIVLASVFARMSRMVPESGGPYAYTRRGFGDFAGFLVGWGYWISIWAANAALAVALVAYLSWFFPVLADRPGVGAITAVSAIWLLTGVNITGIRNAGWVQLVTTILKLIPLVAVGVLGLLWVEPANFRPLNVSDQSNLGALTAAATLTLWAFLGFESATVPADDVDRPEVTIPRATLLGTAIAAVVYILSTIAVMGVIPAAELAASNAPFADAAHAMWGAWAGSAVAIGAIASCFGALNGWILLQGQVPQAAARDGVFPAVFARQSRWGSPAHGLVFSTVLVTVLVSMNFTRGLVDQFTFIILLATLTALLPYALVCMSQLMIFVRERDRFAGQRLLGPTLLAIGGFTFSTWAIAGSGEEIVFWGFLLLLAGVPVYVWVTWQNERDGGSVR